MGRIKTSLIKKMGEEFLSRYPDLFSEDFEANKQNLKKVLAIKSKKLRNALAGYMARKARQARRK